MVSRIALLLCLAAAATGQPFSVTPQWLPDAAPEEADVHAAFRGHFELADGAEVAFRVLGASWYVLTLDGAPLGEGPARFPLAYPEYQTFRARLTAGRHVLAAQAHHVGAATRMLENLPPFLLCDARTAEDAEVPLAWKCARLGGYAQKLRRVNAQFGWVEWCDTRQIPPDWRETVFDDTAWASPVPAEVALGPLRPLSASEVRTFPHSLTALAAGTLVETFGYERDDPPARFFLRDLAPESLPPQGVWRRYDLGRVRLGRPVFTLDLPAGTVVEFAHSEALSGGRVSPWITLSASDSCNLDHYVARGGVQEFIPLTPKGGRFLEVHVLAPPDSVRFVKEAYAERCYYGPAEGAFESGDALLDRIWAVGVETHRACAEDALVDNPTRERGQWAGDVVSVGMDIAAAAYGDLRLCRRGLMQCAQSAREDGMVAGLCPGGAVFLSTYAAQWVTACVHYWELTGDRGLLEEMFPFAERNMAAFRAFLTPEGLSDDAGWGFVDWGYVRNEGPSDMAVNLHYCAALRDMARWCAALGREREARAHAKDAETVRAILDRWFAAQRREGKPDWERIGYHRAVLGMRLGFFTGEETAGGIAHVKRHMLDCFPNTPDAPRLTDPGNAQPRLITPYFAHFAMPLLAEHGETDFMLDQFRACWGWMLGEGRTTWVEVFDTRWSHCHQWAGCPTWQLSRYVLGLAPRMDLGPNHFLWTWNAGSLDACSGEIPIPGHPDSARIQVSWERKGEETLQYTLTTPAPLTLHLPGLDREIAVEAGAPRSLLFTKTAAGWEPAG